MARQQDNDSGVVRTVGVGLLCLVLGAMLAAMFLQKEPQAAAPECPPPPPALECPSCPEAAPKKPRTGPITKRVVPKERDAPLPNLDNEAEARRERLRDWFASHATNLIECVEKGEPRRRLLLKMKIEPDGAIADASLLGADDLSPVTASCVQKRVVALRLPAEDLRGRETLLVYVNL